MRNTITIRTYPGGQGAPNIPYTVTPAAGGAAICSGNTDANGQFTCDRNLSPGPIQWDATDSTVTPAVTRHGTSKSVGSGGAYSLAELPLALRLLGNGVVPGYLNGLAATAGPGINFNVATGAAVALGIPAAVYTAIANQACIQPRDAAQPKACYVIVQWRGLGEALEGETTIFDICGAAAASPLLPGLTQTSAIWQEALAKFTLPPTGGGTTLTGFTDMRRFASGNTQRNTVARRLTQSTGSITTTPTDAVWDSGSADLVLNPGVVYDLWTEVN